MFANLVQNIEYLQCLEQSYFDPNANQIEVIILFHCEKDIQSYLQVLHYLYSKQHYLKYKYQERNDFYVSSLQNAEGLAIIEAL